MALNLFIKTTKLLAVFLLLLSCKKPVDNFRSTLDLSGSWQFAIDSADVGLAQAWFLKDLPEEIGLPGTTDLAKKGFVNTDTSTLHLNRPYQYEGVAWYRKHVAIPKNWEEKNLQLILERTKPTKVWVDGNYIGASDLLESPHHYNLSPHLTPGNHTITIRVDNDLKLTPYGNAHIYSDDTQTNWNGIIGDLLIEASDKTNIRDIQVYPDYDHKKMKVVLGITNQLDLKNLEIELQLSKNLKNENVQIKTAQFTKACDSLIVLEYNFEELPDLWDEYNQPLYLLNAVIKGEKGVKDSKSVSFGFRKFEAKDRQFQINGRTTFLRGKHDACVFPLTGHPPMDVESWVQLFKTAQSYGINHYRFHTWSPPKAAFEAADQVGIYLQPELPFWGGLSSDTIEAQLLKEGLALLKSYANHPSFVMFSPGNEIWGDQDRVENLIAKLKKADSRPLYTQGSNNNIGYTGPTKSADFHIAARLPYAQDTILTHSRLTQAFVDSRDGGILNTQRPSSAVNFDHAVSQITTPLVSHEVGQYQIYPDYKEIDKYTGVLKAWNLEIFKKRLLQSGMINQNRDFTLASGAWSALCYKAEIEAALRTGKMAGFQLLDLQDFPGQGTALVGILDAFMESKNVIAREEWLQFCNDVVPLLVFNKYTWTDEETFSAQIQVANYSNKKIDQKLYWKVSKQNGEIVKEETLDHDGIPFGKLSSLGEMLLSFDGQIQAQKLNIELSILNTEYKNSYEIWVYPAPNQQPKDDQIEVFTEFNRELVDRLNNGGKVLLFPKAASIHQNSLPGLFPPDFWNYGMFKGISEWAKKPISPGTLGILTNPDHPIFNNFPTDSHTNWQWWSIIKHSNSLVLDRTDSTYRPIVQIVDNLERNHKLGLIFEFEVGKGKLLVCTSRLNQILDHPEASQLYQSIIDYMKSEAFQPTYVVNEQMLLELLR